MHNKAIFAILAIVFVSSLYGCSLSMQSSASATLLSSDINKSSGRVIPVGNIVSESDCGYMWSVLLFTGNHQPSHERLITKILERSKADILLDADLSSTFIYIPYVFGMRCAEISGQPALLTTIKEGIK